MARNSAFQVSSFWSPWLALIIPRTAKEDWSPALHWDSFPNKTAMFWFLPEFFILELLWREKVGTKDHVHKEQRGELLKQRGSSHAHLETEWKAFQSHGNIYGYRERQIIKTTVGDVGLMMMTVQRLGSPGVFRKKQILQLLGEPIFKLYLYVRGHGRLGPTSGSYGRFSTVVFFFSSFDGGATGKGYEYTIEWVCIRVVFR